MDILSFDHRDRWNASRARSHPWRSRDRFSTGLMPPVVLLAPM
jgi:hypothetical protein